MHHKHLHSILLLLQKFSKNPINHLESLGLGLEHLRKITLWVAQDPARLSEQHLAWASQMTKVRVFLASGSLLVRLSEQAIFQILGKNWRLSLKRREFRLSDANDEG